MEKNCNPFIKPALKHKRRFEKTGVGQMRISMPTPIVQFEQVRKHYQMGLVTVEALRAVSFGIAPSDYISIMGPSGWGKSTLLNLLGCLDRPTSSRYLLGPQAVVGGGR
jgi:ABC-type glutathione transport system ATPase component